MNFYQNTTKKTNQEIHSNLNSNFMEINWFIIGAIIIGVVFLIYILIRQNKKDRKKIEEELNYVPKEEEAEINNEKES